MRKTLFLTITLLLFLLPGVVLAQDSPQETPQSFYWSINVSQHIMFIGQNLYCNVSGFGNTSFEIEILNIDTFNNSYSEWSRTNSNGTAMVVFDWEKTAIPGNYQVKVSHNRTAVAYDVVRINYDPIEFLKLENKRLKNDIAALEQMIMINSARDAEDKQWIEKVFTVLLIIWVPCMSMCGMVVYKNLPNWMADWAIANAESGKLIFLSRWYNRMTDQIIDYGGQEIYADGDEPKFGEDLKGHEVTGKTTDEALKTLVSNVKRKSLIKEDLPKIKQWNFKDAFKIGRGRKK